MRIAQLANHRPDVKPSLERLLRTIDLTRLPDRWSTLAPVATSTTPGVTENDAARRARFVLTQDLQDDLACDPERWEAAFPGIFADRAALSTLPSFLGSWEVCLREFRRSSHPLVGP